MNRLNLIIGRRKLVIIFVVIAVLIGLMIFWYFGAERQENLEEEPGIEIYIAARDIPAGIEISEGMLETEKISREVFNEKYFTDTENIYGCNTQEDIKKGEIISSDKLEGNYPQENKYLKFSSCIPHGLRAVTIPVNYYGEPALISTGDKVDIISTYYDMEKDMLVSITVLKYKEIILLGGSHYNNAGISSFEKQSYADNRDSSVFKDLFSGTDAGSANTNLLLLTFYLAPEEVESIILSLQTGTLNIAICPG